ncbi:MULTISPECIES: hypothetical protein [Streptomyces]|uniref:hypothetical protein n=1 Tax=Streptomyces TaxID=1883 RepID=UPI00068B042E|nr:hypothetical protein HRD51_30105 [Streptomyces sp. A1-5]
MASSLRCGDRVESLLSDHGSHAHASITDVDDVQSAEDRVTGTGIDGVGTDRALVEVGFGVAGPAVVAQSQEVVQLEEDLSLDRATVTAAFEKVPAVHGERRPAQRVEMGQEGRGVVQPLPQRRPSETRRKSPC